jgi:chromate reductase
MNSMTDSPRPRLLGISGSLRKGSFNTAILASLGAAVEELASLQILPLNDLPPYDQDADTATPPEAVARLRAAIEAADGLVIASPEYNHSISGVLKNALDWASRPFGQSTLSGKPVLTLTSSTAFTGGVRAQAQLNEVLSAIAARLVHRPQTVIGAAHQKIVDGRLVDEATLGFLQAGIEDLLRMIRRDAAD